MSPAVSGKLRAAQALWVLHTIPRREPSLRATVQQSSSRAGYNLALSAWVCGGANLVGFTIATVTKTHYITDLIVRPLTFRIAPRHTEADCGRLSTLPCQLRPVLTAENAENDRRERRLPKQRAPVQGCGTFTVSAWATLIAAMHGNNMSVFSYHRPLFLTIAATCWSVRLAGFLFYRVLCTKGDKCAPSPSRTRRAVAVSPWCHTVAVCSMRRAPSDVREHSNLTVGGVAGGWSRSMPRTTRSGSRGQACTPSSCWASGPRRRSGRSPFCCPSRWRRRLGRAPPWAPGAGPALRSSCSSGHTRPLVRPRPGHSPSRS